MNQLETWSNERSIDQAKDIELMAMRGFTKVFKTDTKRNVENFVEKMSNEKTRGTC